MKKLILLFLTCILLLCGCGSGETMISGRVTKVGELDSDGRWYAITTDDGDEIGVQIKQNTAVGSWIDGDYDIMLLSGNIGETEMIIDVYYNHREKKIMKNNMKTIAATSVMVDSVLEKGIKNLADGTVLDGWYHSNGITYQLSDSIRLLRVNAPSGPDNVYVGNRESFDALSEEAKPVVLQYYEDRGLLYDADALLEQAYEWYKKDKDNFSTYYVEQSVSPSASNEDIMCFLTSVTLPHTNGYMGQEIRLGEIFDRKTGQHINSFDIFNCTPEKAIDTILDQTFSDVDFNTTNIKDVDKFRAEIKAAFKPEYIVLWNENIEVSFPAGSLPTEDHCYIIGIDYTDEIKSIMHPWAVPDTEW